MNEQGSQPAPAEPQVPTDGGEYKPNIYQLIFWALTYGVVAGLGLFVLRLMANYLSLLWGPVFLAALTWGGYRNYLKQKQEWHASRGEAVPQLSPLDQIREAARDIVTASQEVAQQQQEEDALLAQQAAQEEALAAQQQAVPQAQPPAPETRNDTPTNTPPAPPVPPQTPPPSQPTV